MRIRLIAIDLDGTLLNSAKEITEASSAILRTAQEQTGAKVVLASARPPRTVLPFHTLLGLDTPMINYNGALVFDPTCSSVVLHKPIPANIAGGIIRLARARYPKILVSAEVLDRWYTDFFDPSYELATALTHQPDVTAPVGQWSDQEMTKLMLLGPQDWLEDVHAAIHLHFPHQVATVQTEKGLLQIMHATAGKAQALRTVAGELAVSREQVMAIGDNANDVGMLQWAGVGVAMGNAHPEALAAADYVTDHHDADGAAHAIRRIILEGLNPRSIRG